MKANRKFLRNEEEAVSPVIAVILMVAITVVLAATVYVWVSGFGNTGGGSTKSLALAQQAPSAGASATPTSDLVKFTVQSASTGLRYADLSFTLNGITYSTGTTSGDGQCSTADITTAAANAKRMHVEHKGADMTCADGASKLVTAGDEVWFTGADNTALAGKDLKVLDLGGNSIIVTIAVY